LITVLAGVNGAGKSSIGGSNLRAQGGEYFNPDEQSRVLMQAHPDYSLDDANAVVWRLGVERLRQAIEEDSNWTFETTLGGRTVTDLLFQAVDRGIPINIWYCGLESAEKHIERVRRRVARGGHDIPESRIRYRYVESLKNMCRMAPVCRRLVVYDNSEDIDETGQPSPRLLLKAEQGSLVMLADDLPRWARPIAGAFARGSQ